MHHVATRKKVLCPLTNPKTGKTYWMRVGAAFVNRDGSTNVYLDAYPTNGKLQIRDLDADEISEIRPLNENPGPENHRAANHTGETNHMTEEQCPF